MPPLIKKKLNIYCNPPNHYLWYYNCNFHTYWQSKEIISISADIFTTCGRCKRSSVKKKYKDPSQTIFVRNVNEFSARVYRPPSRLFISRNGVENTCFASMKIQLIGSVMLVFIEISFHATRQQISCIKYKKRTKYGFDCKKRPLWRW